MQLLQQGAPAHCVAALRVTTDKEINFKGSVFIGYLLKRKTLTCVFYKVLVLN